MISSQKGISSWYTQEVLYSTFQYTLHKLCYGLAVHSNRRLHAYEQHSLPCYDSCLTELMRGRQMRSLLSTARWLLLSKMASLCSMEPPGTAGQSSTTTLQTPCPLIGESEMPYSAMIHGLWQGCINPKPCIWQTCQTQGSGCLSTQHFPPYSQCTECNTSFSRQNQLMTLFLCPTGM